MGEHRVPLLGSAWRRNDDPATSRDPRVRAVVGALATLPAPEMRADFRAELRTQLVAITPRIVAESDRSGPAAAAPARRPRPTPQGRATPDSGPPARHSDSVVDRVRRLRPGRPLAVATAVIVAFAVLLGGAVVISRRSLPGDALYGLKRAGERLQLATAGSNREKANDYLDFARTRANEVSDLLGRASSSALHGTSAAGVNAGTAKLITSTLGSADDDVMAASRLLGTDAVRHSSPQPLSTMTNWAPAQAARLRGVAAAMSDPALQARAMSSLRLVQAAAARATALKSKLGCDCLGAAGSDQLGPKPCAVCSTTENPGNPTSTTAPSAPGSAGSRSSQGPVNQPGAGGGTGGVPVPGVNGPTGSRGAGGGPLPGIPSGSPTPTPPLINIPSLLPTGAPSAPVSTGSCGVSVSLPLLGGVGIGICNGVAVKAGG